MPDNNETSFSVKEALVALQDSMNARFDKMDESHSELCGKVEGIEQMLSFIKGASFIVSAILVWVGWPEFKQSVKGIFS